MDSPAQQGYCHGKDSLEEACCSHTERQGAKSAQVASRRVALSHSAQGCQPAVNADKNSVHIVAQGKMTLLLGSDTLPVNQTAPL